MVAVFDMYKFELNHILSVDESEFSCVQKPTSVIAVKNRLRLPQVSSEDALLSRGVPPGSTWVNEGRFIRHLAQDFRLRSSAFHSEPHTSTSNNEQQLKSCVRLKL
jgi:hypothetical protein